MWWFVKNFVFRFQCDFTACGQNSLTRRQSDNVEIFWWFPRKLNSSGAETANPGASNSLHINRITLFISWILNIKKHLSKSHFYSHSEKFTVCMNFVHWLENKVKMLENDVFISMMNTQKCCVLRSYIIRVINSKIRVFFCNDD